MPTGRFLNDGAVPTLTIAGIDRTNDRFLVHDSSAVAAAQVQAAELLNRTLASADISALSSMAVIASIDLTLDQVVLFDASANGFVRMTCEQFIGRILQRANITGMTNLSAASSVDVTNDRFLVWDASAAGFVTLTAAEVISRLWQTPTTAMTTTPQTVTSTQSGQTFSNVGAAVQITVNLPAATVGLRYSFVRHAAYDLLLDGNASETINGGETYRISNRGRVDIECFVAGTWTLTQKSGSSGLAVINVKDYGAVGDGVADDTAEIAAAIAAAGQGGAIYFPEGTYLVSGELAVTNLYVSLIGDGRSQSVIRQSTATGSTVRVEYSNPLVVGGPLVIRGLSIDGTGNTSGTKTALEIVDVANIEVSDFSVTNWTGVDSVGIRYRGRQHASFRDVNVVATLPFRVSANPNGPSAGRLSGDFLNLDNVELVRSGAAPSTLTNACLLVDDGAQITNATFKQVAYVGGTYGHYQNITGTPGWETYGLSFDNCRKEGGASAGGYSFYLGFPTAARCRSATFTNCTMEIDTGQGIFADFVTSISIDGCQAFGATHTNTINADNFNALTIDAMYTNNTAKALNVGTSAARVWAVFQEGYSCPVAGVWSGFGSNTYLPSDRPFAVGRAHKWTWEGSLTDDQTLEIMNNADAHITCATVVASGSCGGGSPAAGGGIWHLSPQAVGSNGILLLAGTNAVATDTDNNLCIYTSTAALGGAIILRNRLGATAQIVLDCTINITGNG